MTRDDIIRLAREAGIYYRDIEDEFCEADKDGVPLEMMVKFAALVAAAEREACVRVCDVQIASEALTELEKYRAGFIADVIRARGESK